MYINLLQNKHYYVGFCFVIRSTNGMTSCFVHTCIVCACMLLYTFMGMDQSLKLFCSSSSSLPCLPSLFLFHCLLSLLLVLSSPCALFHLLYQLLSVYKGISTYDYIVEQRNEAPRESRCNTTELCSCSKVNLTLHVMMSLLNCIIIHMHVCT